MKPCHIRSRIWVALVAAFVILLQASVASWAAGSMAGLSGLDAFGNPLCMTGEDGGQPMPADHGNMPTCCTFGCPLAAPLLAPLAGEPAWLPRAAAPEPAPVATADDPSSHPGGHAPQNPRAPPYLA